MGAYGVAAASLLYFDKSVHELTVAEAAYLAALPKAPQQLPSVPPARARHRAAQLRPRPHGRGPLHHRAGSREGEEGAAQGHAAPDRRPYLRGRIFRRGSPPLHPRQLQREEALRGRPLGAHHARSQAAGAGAQGAGRRLRALRRAAGLSRRASPSSTSAGEWGAKLAEVKALSDIAPWRLAVVLESRRRSRRASACSPRASRAARSPRSARPAPSRSKA